MRDTATYHFATRQAALDFVAACDELEIPAAEPPVIARSAPYVAQALLDAPINYDREYLNELAGSPPAAYEVGRCPFARIAESEPGHATALARCFIAANEPSQLFACIRFARRAGLLPEGCYIGGAFFGPHELRFSDTSGEFLNGAFDEFRDAAYEYLGWRDAGPDLVRDDEAAAEYCEPQAQF